MNDPAKPVASYVTNRAKEPSTWAGLFSTAFAAWVAFSAGNIEAAAAAVGAIVAGLIPIFVKERK